MANFMDLMQGQLSNVLIDQLSSQMGGADPQKTAIAANGLMSTIMDGLARNASTPKGASSLLGALDQDHDGSILDDVVGLIGGQGQQSRTSNGAGILRHVLGDKSDNVLVNVAKMSGLDLMSVANMAMKLAPMAMGLLGKQKKEQSLDARGLGDFLSKSVQHQQKADPEGGILFKLLDQDGDGNVVDDIASIGMKMFGSFLKR